MDDQTTGERDPIADELAAIRAYHAARVRQARTSRGWSQREFGARFDPPAAQSSVHQWEQPDHHLGFPTMGRIARAFDTTIAELFGVTWEPVGDDGS